jgi:hypothetical protein
MSWKRPFQIFVLLTLLFSPFGLTQLRASASSIDQSGVFQTQPIVSMSVSPASINIGGTATVTVRLDNVPAEGFTSLELTCTYDPNLVEASDILVADLFGADPAVAIKGPQYDRFIVAIAGNQGNKATSSGTVLAFNVTGKQAGQSPMECQARVSNGDNALTAIASTGNNVMIMGPSSTLTPWPTATPTTTVAMRITIDPGRTTASRVGIINPNETIRYLLNAAAGQVLSIKLTAPTNEVAIGVISPTGLVLKPLDASLIWSATISTGGDHTITLIALTGSSSKSYTLEVSLTPPVATATPTIKPSDCDKAEFIDDVNVPPGTVISPSAQFTKAWSIRNVGSCTWTTSYRIALLSGEQMGAPSSARFSTNVLPGQTIVISLDMTAPSTPGAYRGYWIFQNDTGGLFGVGPLGNEPWFVDIVVANGSVTPTFTPSSSILQLTKHASPQTYSAPDQTIIYTFAITNTGTTALGPAQFIITDDKLGAPLNCGPAGVILARNQSLSCSVDYKTTSADMALANITSTATASGAGQTSAPATVVVANLVAPATPTPSITPGGSTATAMPGVVYDFVAAMCSATWFSGAGQLPCPGIEANPNGFVFKVDHPMLENGTADTRPGLLTFPQNVQNGYIQGFYPAFHVQAGDRFRSILSCESGATDCYLAFRLDYQIGADPIRTLFGPFLERYDGRYYTADIDLSSLAGKDVKFILTVLSAGYPAGDRALWVGPVITRTNVASATSTPATEIPSTLTIEASPTQTPTVEGGSLTPTELPGTGTPMPAVGLLNGKVFASKLVRIEAYDANGNLVGAGWTNPDGSYEFYAASGTNSVVAMASGFLSAQRSVTVTDGSTTTLPTITLIPGDIDGNHVIDQFDALTIGMNYNKATPSEADMNNDGIINVLDLELLASNYRKTGPIPWE